MLQLGLREAEDRGIRYVKYMLNVKLSLWHIDNPLGVNTALMCVIQQLHFERRDKWVI